MEKQITFWLGAVLLLAALDSSQAQVIPSYFMVGGDLVLRPTGTGAITNILWKYNGNLLAEWVKNEVPLTYYDKYDGRTTLDPVSGRLEVKNMNTADEGLYTVEINNKVHGQSYDVKAISKVPKPSVVVRPLTCSTESESCFLNCDGKEPESLTEAEPIKYSWKMGEGEWKKMKQDITITSDETRDVKTISCRMENPVSQDESEPEKNPMYKEPVTPGPGPGAIVGGIAGAIAVLAAVVVGLCAWQKKKCGSDIESSHPFGSTPTSPQAKPKDDCETELLSKSEIEAARRPEGQLKNTSEPQPDNSASH